MKILASHLCFCTYFVVVDGRIFLPLRSILKFCQVVHARLGAMRLEPSSLPRNFIYIPSARRMRVTGSETLAVLSHLLVAICYLLFAISGPIMMLDPSKLRLHACFLFDQCGFCLHVMPSESLRRAAFELCWMHAALLGAWQEGLHHPHLTNHIYMVRIHGLQIRYAFSILNSIQSSLASSRLHSSWLQPRIRPKRCHGS